MKPKYLIAALIFAMFACQNKDKTESKNIIEKIAEDTLSKTVAGTADVSDVPAKEDKTVELIQKQLTVLLKKDLPAMTAKDRFFYYDAFDLNNDQKNEYFVGFSSPYFCGSGGCTAYLLNNDGSLINTFTVTDFPIYVTTLTTDNFYDLIIRSGGKLHHIKIKNGKYPSNPSIEHEHKGAIPKEHTKVLDFDAKKSKKYSF
ncbi:hypothetical protein [Flavobacterium hercynium]|uniref:Lipoprotein n=1 Tax=Flavobacterium hercynium TaxID=387094 RepID=A0A226GP54_9FLAO|nr:hypothetical protein [Flavobacterium hercynium]OXA83829.1 hypothetical protein B0A66_21945 [Flavobacterium hercynium]SMP31440.1 hypothetical protein SAMN06265346_11437 [Flavobacterium hercynium]